MNCHLITQKKYSKFVRIMNEIKYILNNLTHDKYYYTNAGLDFYLKENKNNFIILDELFVLLITLHILNNNYFMKQDFDNAAGS